MNKFIKLGIKIVLFLIVLFILLSPTASFIKMIVAALSAGILANYVGARYLENQNSDSYPKSSIFAL